MEVKSFSKALENLFPLAEKTPLNSFDSLMRDFNETIAPNEFQSKSDQKLPSKLREISIERKAKQNVN